MRILELENTRIILVHDKKASIEVLSADCLNRKQFVPQNYLDSTHLISFIKKYGDDPTCTEKKLFIGAGKIVKTFYTYSTLKNIYQIRIILLDNKYVILETNIIIEIRCKNSLDELYYLPLDMNNNSEQNKELIQQILHEIFLRLVHKYGVEQKIEIKNI